MEAKTVELTNKTDVGGHYMLVPLFHDFNGSAVHNAVEATPATGWPGKIALGLLLSSFIVIALAGNTLVIVAVVTDRNLRRTSNYFIVSLRTLGLPW